MGRPKATKLKGNFILRTDRKADRNGRYCVYIDYTLQSRHAKVATEVWVEEKFFDKKKGEIPQSHPFSAKLNRQLEIQRHEIDERIFDYSQRHRLTIDALRALIQGKVVPKGVRNTDDFVDYAIKVINEEYKLQRIGISVRDNALCGFNLFRKFLRQYHGEDSLYIKELSVELIREYIFWRQGNGNTNETINKALTPIIKAARRASSEKLIDSAIYDELSRMYLPSRLAQGEEDASEVHYLTEEQLRRFAERYTLSKYPRTKDYIDIFLFSFYACGMRISDIITLEWKSVNLEKREIRKVINKSDRIHTIPLNDGAISILERWKERNCGRFVFGLLKDDFDLTDESELKRMRLNKNRAIQTSLKEIGNKLGLPFTLSMHVARHTFAVLALNKGVDVHIISRLMGHSSIMVTEKTYAQFLPSTLQDEVMTHLNFNF
ncbi:MAG: site-specific integrase [Lachnospiraceae bacterium]|nr:site-specific integrase [Lachnospiraceae bacterium]